VVRSFFSEDGSLKSFAAKAQLHGADLCDQAGTGEAALHWAVVGGQLSMVNLLLQRGAPLDELNTHGGTALGQAGWSFVNGEIGIDYIPIFEALLAAGAKIQHGWLGWLEQQGVRPAEERSRVAELFRRYGAST
jgi:hypothetical protein